MSNQEKAQKLIYATISKTLNTYYGKAPDNIKTPCIVYNNVVNSIYMGMTGNADVQSASNSFTYQVDIYADKASELLAYKEQVMDDIHLLNKNMLITDTEDIKDEGFRARLNVSVFIN